MAYVKIGDKVRRTYGVSRAVLGPVGEIVGETSRSSGVFNVRWLTELTTEIDRRAIEPADTNLVISDIEPDGRHGFTCPVNPDGTLVTDTSHNFWGRRCDKGY